MEEILKIQVEDQEDQSCELFVCVSSSLQFWIIVFAWIIVLHYLSRFLISFHLISLIEIKARVDLTNTKMTIRNRKEGPRRLAGSKIIILRLPGY